MPAFRTRLFCYPEGRPRTRILRGNGWSIKLTPDREHSRFANLAAVEHEIIIIARTLSRAEAVAELLLASEALLDGAQSWFGETIVVHPERPPDNPAERAAHDRFMHGRQGAGGSLHVAVEVAGTISRRRRFQYALYRLRMSYRACSVHHMDLDPSHWRPQQAVFDDPPYHVALATAIQLAYSAVEELGLEVRASADTPSTVDGRWNPPVLNDLIKRLAAAGVATTEEASWYRRGTPSAIERRYPFREYRKSSWSHRRIRDVEVPLVDAILHASRLRSRVSAHRLPAIAASLTVYDAVNVQHLARRLLLASSGHWRRRRRTPAKRGLSGRRHR